ncbi:dipeptidase PepV [Sutcliffiella rhizosphaerae]|uniref:Dipeptidase n=1 Tax=Sutcliffiella rhizosphaerae TaxID=2880967 RepID=A0ABN8AF51_9BACI|nr:dipeptidase PepV [Sutcliffiella rhizosphaerae]CAG9622147.1 Putative dipeptidase [Sutcliffiella rhizosphaerae]
MGINWLNEVEMRKDDLIKDTQALLQINSVLNEEEVSPESPFGKGIEEALQFLLQKGKADGFVTKNVDHFAGHIEHGQGKDLVGILCHVDVVPEGDGWTDEPFSATIRDGKIFARGAIDDKGPTMAAYYALKIVKEMELPLSKRVRIIIGTDEESGWQCVDHYFKQEEMPTIGFAPDADFPIIHAEKGLGDIQLHLKFEGEENQSPAVTLLSFDSGRRLNMVPDHAQATLEISEGMDEITHAFQSFISENAVEGEFTEEGSALTLSIKGVSAHAMEPDNGVNAGYHLATFLNTLPLDLNAATYVAFISEKLAFDSRGKKLGIDYHDAVSADLTVNVGVFHYEKEASIGSIGVNIRFPVTCDTESVKGKLMQVTQENSFEVNKFRVVPPHHVPKEHELIQTLQKVYEEQTGEKADLLAIGGGTYARSLQAGVAFGPLFPGREDVAHQKDEHIFIEDLVKATAIYAQAIYELAK